VLCLSGLFSHLIASTKTLTLKPFNDKSSAVQAMFGAISRRYDLANHLLSGGLDVLWRQRTARTLRGWSPGRILDLATGSGDLALTLRSACPEAWVLGADFCPPMLRIARRKGLNTLVAADGLRLPFEEGVFDAVTIAFGLRNMASWEGGLAEMRRVLRPGGHLLVLDFSIPKPPLRWIYGPYLHYVLPRLAALVTGQKAAYDYLGDSIEQFPQGPMMCELMRAAGFVDARFQPMTGGIVTLYTAMRPG
jgi:demethylmenaquinone methyltransferase/2-methoxy-6-polyprenyl-1,4-benzoquinol methylase